MALQPHDSVASYVLIRPLGRGTFGEVWLARHQELGEERALKVPTDREYVRQLRTQGQIQFRLNHPNIVRTLDLNTLHDPPFYVMEFVPGASLRQKLHAAGKLPVAEAYVVLRQILLALEHAHGAGICHRDLKPENVLCQTDGNVKVADFGFGKVQAAWAQSMMLSGSLAGAGGGGLAGTLHYMSPQQLAGDEADPRDDLYSVGVIACELLTGSRPQAIGVTKMLERAGTDVKYAPLLETAMEQARTDRYASAGEMLGVLDAIAATSVVAVLPVQAPPPPPPLRFLHATAMPPDLSAAACHQCGAPLVSLDQAYCLNCGAARPHSLGYAPAALGKSKWVWNLFFRNFFLIVAACAPVVGYLVRQLDPLYFPISLAVLFSAMTLAALAQVDHKAARGSSQWLWCFFFRNSFIALGVGAGVCAFAGAAGIATWEVPLSLFAVVSVVAFVFAFSVHLIHATINKASTP